ncbi:MAG: efflux RND transporter periplasmic adaptor subunit, partial [Planctomycetota bacterium]
MTTSPSNTTPPSSDDHSKSAPRARRRGVMSRVSSVARFMWSHTAAIIAIALIAGAFYVGLETGRPPAPEQEADDQAADAGGTAGGAKQFFTCSMHPSVRLPNPEAKCPICFMDLIPASDEANDPAARRRLELTAEAAALANISTMPVQRFMPRAEVRLYGTLTYDETRIARLTARFPGRVERLYVHYVGTPIRESDHVVDIYSPELLAAFEELRQAREAVDNLGRNASPIVRESSEEALTAARERLRLLGLDRALIEQVERDALDDDSFTVPAPIGGIVTAVSAVEGDYLNTGSPIATVADLDRLWLNLEAYESQIGLLQWGQPVTFTVAARPGEQFEGRIAYIEPEIDPHTRTAAVRVAFNNETR